MAELVPAFCCCNKHSRAERLFEVLERSRGQSSRVFAAVATHRLQSESRLEFAHFVVSGQRHFPFDTFGSKFCWADQLGIDEAIAGQQNGGVG
jgi:hypothetical protein